MMTFKSVISIVLMASSGYCFAADFTYAEGQRIFEADLWNEVYGKTYPYKIDRNVIITKSEIKDNALIHYMTFYERKMPFKRADWEEGNKAMLEDNFCSKGYVQSFPIILRLDVTVKSNERDNNPRKEIIITNSKEVCK